LDYSKIEQGKLMLDASPLNLGDLCTSVVDMLRHTKHADVELIASAPAGVAVMGDVVRWRQLLINLVSNSLKFTSSGVVSLSMERVRSPGQAGSPGDAETAAVGKGNRGNAIHDLYVEISDTGPGIPPSLMPVLFQKYSQGGFHSGSGLGLNIAQRIAELMGTSIQVTSPWLDSNRSGSGNINGSGNNNGSNGKPILGTKFSFTINQPRFCASPVAGSGSDRQGRNMQQRHHRTSRTTPSETEGEATPTLTIVVVEDDKLNCAIMKAKLQQSATNICDHLVVRIVHSGEEAIALYDELKGSIDLVVMDEYLDKEGGTLKGSETTKELREKGCTAVIVACSGNCLAGDKDRFIAAGANFMWPKPYPDRETMAKDLFGWFGGHGE
jgi:CheY-like chemotaxis protein